MGQTKATPEAVKAADEIAEDCIKPRNYSSEVMEYRKERAKEIAATIDYETGLPALKAKIDRLETEKRYLNSHCSDYWDYIASLEAEKAELVEIAAEALNWWHADDSNFEKAEPEFIRLAHKSEIARETAITSTNPS